MTYVPTSEQVADVFIKGLHKSVFEKVMGKLGMSNIFISAWGECG